MTDATVTRLRPGGQPAYTDTAAVHDIHALLTATTSSTDSDLLGDIALVVTRTGRPMVRGRDIDTSVSESPTGWPIARVDAEDTTVTVRQNPAGTELLIEITTRTPAERGQLAVTLMGPVPAPPVPARRPRRLTPPHPQRKDTVPITRARFRRTSRSQSRPEMAAGAASAARPPICTSVTSSRGRRAALTPSQTFSFSAAPAIGARAPMTSRPTCESSRRARLSEPRVRDQWAANLEAKHGMALDQIPGKVYVLHYEIPQVVKSVSADYAGVPPKLDGGRLVSARPIRHYVGWTQQDRPSKRISAHGPAAMRDVVYLEPGTTADERAMKLTGACPKCGEPLSKSLGSHAPPSQHRP